MPKEVKDRHKHVSRILASMRPLLNKSLKKQHLRFVKTRIHPKRVMEFAVHHTKDKHPIGFLRGFAFAATRKGFKLAVQLHLDEKNALKSLEERTALPTKKAQEVFKRKIARFVQSKARQLL